MCVICELGRSPVREEIKGNTLDISWCQKVSEIQVPEGLQKLSCSGCTNLTSLGPLPKSLQRLDCDDCTNLTSLGPLPEGLRVLYFSGCTSLMSLGPLPEGLQRLDCSRCTNLTSLGSLPESLQELYRIGYTNLTSLGPLPESLQVLYCSNCTNLTSLGPLSEGLRELYCGGCPLLTQVGPQSVIDHLRDYTPSIWTPSENLENNLKKLVILQRFCRSLRVRKLLRLSRTKEFCEWFYNPENYGGKWAKETLRKLVL
jgi:hypothetical protein